MAPGIRMTATGRSYALGRRAEAERAFGGDDDLIAPAFDGRPENLLGYSIGIDVGRIEHGQAGFEADIDESRGLGHTGLAPRLELLAPAAVTHLTSHAVSTDVNSVRHNGPGLIEPLAAAAGPAGAASREGAREHGGAPHRAPGTLF